MASTKSTISVVGAAVLSASVTTAVMHGGTIETSQAGDVEIQLSTGVACDTMDRIAGHAATAEMLKSQGDPAWCWAIGSGDRSIQIPAGDLACAELDAVAESLGPMLPAPFRVDDIVSITAVRSRGDPAWRWQAAVHLSATGRWKRT
jgi:hypothetical protein